MVNKILNDRLTGGWRTTLLFGLFVLFPVLLLLPRAFLSIGMIVFFFLTFFHQHLKEQLRYFISQPLLWGMSLLFLLPFISGAWTADQQTWREMMQVKLPLLLLPLAFAGPIDLSPRQWRIVSYTFIMVAAAGSLWSLSRYTADPITVNEGYLRAKTMLTPLENDHVRFSWLVAVAILVSVFIAVKEFKQHKSRALLAAAISLWLIIFLHLLSARTGLLSLYLMAAITGGWLIRQKWKYGLLVLAMMIALPFATFRFFPTFQNRVKYFRYEYDFFKHADYRPGFNDGVRVISLKAGWNVLIKHPVKGVGYGDILPETKKWYAANYPEMIPADQIYPGSQWLLYGTGCGIGGLIVFAAVMLIPFFTRTRQTLFWYLLNATVFFSFLFDIGLEVQYGVFLYAMIVLMAWRGLRGNREKEEKRESVRVTPNG